MASLFDGLLNLIGVKAGATADGGYAITVGGKELNAGIKFGPTGVDVWGEAGPTYARAGLNSTAGAYGLAGIDNFYEVGAQASAAGASAYKTNLQTGLVQGAGWTPGIGAAGFTYDHAAEQPTVTPTWGTAEAANNAAQLVSSIGAFTASQGSQSVFGFSGRASTPYNLPSLATLFSGVLGTA